MTNKGVVKAVNGEMLTVVFERHEACGDCHACMRGSSDCSKHTVTIPGKAQVGDVVVVEMDDSHVMAASALAYMIPLAGFMLGLLAGYAAHVSEPVMALCALIGTGLAYLVMRALDPHFSKGRWEQRIVSVSRPEKQDNPTE